MLNPSRGPVLALPELDQPVLALPEVVIEEIEEMDVSPKDVNLSESSDSSVGSPVQKRMAKSSQCLFSGTDESDTDESIIENVDSTPRAKKAIPKRDLMNIFGPTPEF